MYIRLPLGNQTSPTIKGGKVEPLHTWLKDIFRNPNSQTAIWMYLKRQLKHWPKAKPHTITNKIKIKEINFWDWY